MPLPSTLKREQAAQRQANALDPFNTTEATLTTLQQQVAGIEQTWRRAVEGGDAKTRLAELESSAKKLESDIDNVIIGSLGARREQAREVRRSQLARLDQLFDQIDGLFEQIKDKGKRAAQAAEQRRTGKAAAGHRPPTGGDAARAQKLVEGKPVYTRALQREDSSELTDVPGVEDVLEDDSDNESWGDGSSSGSEKRSRLLKCCCWMPKSLRVVVFGDQ